MLELRPKHQLGGHNHGWLDTKHHFSFAGYHDPNRMNWGQLRVINDDTIAPHTGFSAHPHKDMEIITYVREGAISHKDSLGNVGRTEAGHIQVMTAGTGIVHEEKNHEPVLTKIFQIWLMPKALGLTPKWSSRRFPKDFSAGKLTQLASGRNAQPQALALNADADIFGGSLDAGSCVRYQTEPNRFLYIVLATGYVRIAGIDMRPGDGLAIRDEVELSIAAVMPSEILLVDASSM